MPTKETKVKFTNIQIIQNIFTQTTVMQNYSKRNVELPIH